MVGDRVKIRRTKASQRQKASRRQNRVTTQNNDREKAQLRRRSQNKTPDRQSRQSIQVNSFDLF